MASLSATGLADQLRQNRVILAGADDGELNRLLTRHGEARALAAALVARGWLTHFQAAQLLEGRSLILGAYVVLERLGEGGAGQVFKARHIHMQRVVALKVIRSELLAEAEVVTRFYREIQVASQLSHPNVVQAYDAGPAGATHLLAMEFVDGLDLERFVRQHGPLPVGQACDFVRQAALGLQHIHECGLVHRDVKPANLLLASKGQRPPARAQTIKILDLGLARLQTTNKNGAPAISGDAGTTMGTVDYMSPEQALSFHQVDIRADIYSLGCTFYFLLTGRAPFAGSLAEKLMRHQQGEPEPVENVRQQLPRGLPALLRKMMAKDPAQRFQTPGAVAQELARLLESGPAAAKSPAGRRAARRQWLAALGATGLAALGGLGGLAWFYRPRDPAAPAAPTGGPPVLATTRPQIGGTGGGQSLTITTREGQGGDAAVVGNGTARRRIGSVVDRLTIRNGANNRRKVWLRFETPPLAGRRVVEAELVLTTMANEASNVHLNIFGLKDGDPGEAWPLANITWDNAPANVTDNGGGPYDLAAGAGGGVDPQRTVFLGTLAVAQPSRDGAGLIFTSPRLVEYLNRDANQLVTLIVTAVEPDQPEVSLAGRQKTTMPPPTLKLRIQ